MMKPFQVLDEPLAPRMIVEASAGTGKTHTITDLFLRLLVETGRSIDEILVVTFTRMAARELKERILTRLHMVVDETGKSGSGGVDPSLDRLVRFCSKQDGGRERLQSALLDFDDVQVYTIHGFCQKVLNDQALVSRSPFGLEVQEGNGLKEEAAKDFWRIFVDRYSSTESGKYYIQKASQLAGTPPELLNILKPLPGKPDAIIEPAVSIDPILFLSEVIEAGNRIKETWTTERREILNQLVESNISGMGEKKVASLGRSVDTFVNDEGYTIDAPHNLHLLASSWLGDDKNLTKSGNRKPEHPFFDQCEQLQNLLEEMPDVQTAFLSQASTEISRILKESTRHTPVLSYDDLLSRLHSALLRPGTGSVLAETIRRSCPCALVDEFQDTDPLQYQIFDQIYPSDSRESSLVMIGDPKQAIYGFRGADVYAYLRARESAEQLSRFTLLYNYRSSSRMIDAVNQLYSVTEGPFIDKSITFRKISKGADSPVRDIHYSDASPAPLQIHYSSGVSSKNEIKNHLYTSLCNQVSELTRLGNQERVRIEDKPLSAGDIAVIVHSNRDASRIRDMLRERGTGSVIYSRDRIFESVEAEHLERLLASILEPGDLRAASTALSTGLFGNRLETIYPLLSEPEAREKFIQLLLSLGNTWKKRGIYSMYRRLLIAENGLQHLAGQYNSERVITNFQHLVELAAREENEKRLSPAGLFRWFKSRHQNSGSADQQELRLEDDRNLVKIITIHNSKGLEFPVVFCASLWEASVNKKPIHVYHDPEREYETVINLGQKKSLHTDRAILLETLEDTGEEVRKGYVAVTRAKYECRIFWASAKLSHLSAIGAAVLGGKRVSSGLSDKTVVKAGGEITDESFLNLFRKLSDSSGGSVSLHEIDTESTSPFLKNDQKEEVALLKSSELKLPENIFSGKHMYSYSSLVHSTREPDEKKDYEQWTEQHLSRDITTTDKIPDLSLFNFPKGAMAGTVIHKLFEQDQLDFRNPGLSAETVVGVLESSGFDGQWAGTMQKMIEDVIQADYGELQMDKVSSADHIKEMEFQFSTNSLSGEKMLSLIRSESIVYSPTIPLAGYMTGFIDLIVKQNNRYYIIDYKSNYLGNLFEDYKPDKLYSEIVASKYDVQYHIYILALIKYLRQRVENFDYETHFGGVYYSFIRGMRSGSGNGIFYRRPDVKLINKLETEIKRND